MPRGNTAFCRNNLSNRRIGRGLRSGAFRNSRFKYADSENRRDNCIGQGITINRRLIGHTGYAYLNGAWRLARFLSIT